MKRLPHLILSVDWDYFMMMDTLLGATSDEWIDNPSNIKIDQTAIKSFWAQVIAPGCPVAVEVSRDHKDIYNAALMFDRVKIVNFDAHHDGGYEPVGITTLDCSNWALHLQRRKILLDYTVVYPEWRKDEPEESKSQATIDRRLYGQWPDAPMKAITVFICRSDPWMPPWLDDLFVQFVNDLTRRCEYPELVHIEPEAMKPRTHNAVQLTES